VSAARTSPTGDAGATDPFAEFDRVVRTGDSTALPRFGFLYIVLFLWICQSKAPVYIQL
jgi:hypothetical protein